MADENKVAQHPVAAGAVSTPEVKTVVSTDSKVIDKAISEGGEIEDVSLVEEATVVKKEKTDEAPTKAATGPKMEVVDNKVVITVGPKEAPKETPKVGTVLPGAKLAAAKPEVKKEAPKRLLPHLEMPEEYPLKQRLNILFYGDPGVGKTILAGTAQDVPEMRQVINIDAEGGHKVLAYRGDIPRFKIKSYRELAAVYEWVRAHCYHRSLGNMQRVAELEALARGLDAPPEKPMMINTVILDSMTEIQKYCMYQILGLDPSTQKLDYEPASAEIQEWGTSYEMIQVLIRNFRDLDVNVIACAAADNVQDDRKRLIYSPMLPGKLSKGIMYFFDHIGYYWAFTAESGEVIRRVYFQPGITYRAKNRFKDLKGTYIEAPTMQGIYELEQLPPINKP